MDQGFAVDGTMTSVTLLSLQSFVTASVTSALNFSLSLTLGPQS